MNQNRSTGPEVFKRSLYLLGLTIINKSLFFKEKTGGMTDTMREKAREAKDKTQETAQQAQDQTSQKTEEGKEKTHESKEKTKGALQHTGDKVKQMAEDAAEAVKTSFGMAHQGEDKDVHAKKDEDPTGHEQTTTCRETKS